MRTAWTPAAELAASDEAAPSLAGGGGGGCACCCRRWLAAPWRSFRTCHPPIDNEW
eukprot:SAG25_NODE_845_length_5085_cov_16.777978_10_plen_56_part_00